MHRRGGGASRFYRNFLSHRTETKSFVKEPFCFPENFWYRKKIWIRGGISRFSVEIFVSHSAEKFRKGILLCLRKFLVSKNFMDEKGGCHVFLSKICGLTVPKNFVGIPSLLQKIWGIEKFLCIIGGITFFPQSKIFGLTVPKNFVKKHFSVSLISGIKKC